jgi:hypothetical protein
MLRSDFSWPPSNLATIVLPVCEEHHGKIVSTKALGVGAVQQMAESFWL